MVINERPLNKKRDKEPYTAVLNVVEECKNIRETRQTLTERWSINGWNVMRVELVGRSQHISLNKIKLDSSDHQMVEVGLINTVMRPKVCRARLAST